MIVLICLSAVLVTGIVAHGLYETRRSQARQYALNDRIGKMR